MCNELNERLTATRAVPEITWLAILALLDGCQWSNAARWTTHADGQSAMAAEFNPFLQFSLGISVWIFVLVLQFLLQRIGCIFLGHDLNDFMDVCSIANISVFILDETWLIPTSPDRNVVRCGKGFDVFMTYHAILIVHVLHT